MAKRPRGRARGLILLTGALSGLVLGLVIVSVATGGGVQKKPARYAPFPAGSAARIERSIERGGPIFYPDPSEGTDAFYLDLEAGKIVALAVVLPGGRPECPVVWDRRQRRYEDCENAEVAREELQRFRTVIQGTGDGRRVFVDIRTVVPAPAAAS